MNRPFSLIVVLIVWCALAGAKPSSGQIVEDGCWSAEPLRFPAGEKNDVLARTLAFLVEEEKVPPHPYWPGGKSGVTIGVGWDLGQHSAQQLADTWSKLPSADIHELKIASGVSGANASALARGLGKIFIPRDVAMDVLGSEVGAVYYPAATRVFPGFELLPTGAQVALISVVFNRGAAMGREPDWLTAMEVDTRWEMREFRDDVQRRDMYAVYAHLGTMKRLWESGTQKGLLIRRRNEQALIRPYALQELRWEEKRVALRAKGLLQCPAAK